MTTRRNVLALLAAGSSLAFVADTAGFTRAGVGHAPTVDVPADDPAVRLESEAFETPVDESQATITIASRFAATAVTRIESREGTFAFDPDPATDGPLELTEPVTVDVRTRIPTDGVVADAIVAVVEGPAVRAGVERRLFVDGGVDDSV